MSRPSRPQRSRRSPILRRPHGPATPAHAVSSPRSPTQAPTLADGVLPVPVPRPVGTTQQAFEETSPPTTEVAESTESSTRLIVLGGAACFILGGLLLLVVIAKLGSRNREPDRPTTADTSSPPSSQIVRLTPESSRKSGWSSVSRGVAIDLNSVVVDVSHVGYGELRAKDARNRVVVSDQKCYLQAYLKIKNLRPDP